LKSELGRVRVSKASYGRLDVKINRLVNPPTAEADFMGYIQAKDTRGEIPFETFARRFKVVLRQDGDRWLLVSYDIDGLPEGSY